MRLTICDLICLCLGWIRAQQMLQASPFAVPLEFPGATVGIHVSGRSEALDCTVDTFNYALMAWTRQYQVSTSGFSFFGLYTNNCVNFKVVKIVGGAYEASVYNEAGIGYVLAAPGEFNRWEHIAVGVCAGAMPYTFTVCTTTWRAASTTCQSVLVATRPVAYSPDFTYMNIGDSAFGLMYGQLVDIRLYSGGCISDAVVFDWISGFSCAAVCQGTCTGPGFSYCGQFAQLLRPDFSKISYNDEVSWDVNSPELLGRDLSGSISFSGWFNANQLPTLQENFYKLENSRCYMPGGGSLGCQVLGVYHSPTHYLLYIEDTTGVVSTASIADVRDMQPGTLNTWVFVTGAVCHSPAIGHLCIAQWGDASVQCADVSPTPGADTLHFTGTTVYVGDLEYQGINGLIRDLRLYQNTCLDSTSANSLYSDVSSSCGFGCVSCFSPEYCAGCEFGYYLNNDNQCAPCHTCCDGCTGPGYTSCINCSAYCHNVGENSCARNCVSRLSPDLCDL